MRAWALALLVGAGCGAAPEPCPGCLVLHDVTVIDGTGADPVPGQTILVRAGRIAAIEASATAQPPPGAEVRDLRGRFVVPGFVDTHAHVAVLPLGADGRLADRMDRMDREATEAVLRTLVAFGITTVRNPAAPAADGVALRDAVASREILGPTIVTAGEAIGIGGLRGWTEASVRAEVRRQVAVGVDLVKVYAPLGPDLVRAAAEEAHGHGLEVVAHLGRTTWGEAASAGVDHVTHLAPWTARSLPPAQRAGYRATLLGRLDWLEHVDLDGPMIRDDLAALAAAGITLDPTLVALHTKFWGDDPRYTASPDSVFVPPLVRSIWRRGTFVDDWAPEDFGRARRLWPRAQALVRRMYAAGVPLTAGSDLPNPWVVPGASFHTELALLAEAGIPPLAVLRIATANGAGALGLADRTGTVEVGKEADPVVLARDPTADLSATRAIDLVVLDGRPIVPAEVLGRASIFRSE